jgi:hypothetical protein
MSESAVQKKQAEITSFMPGSLSSLPYYFLPPIETEARALSYHTYTTFERYLYVHAITASPALVVTCHCRPSPAGSTCCKKATILETRPLAYRRQNRETVCVKLRTRCVKARTLPAG